MPVIGIKARTRLAISQIILVVSPSTDPTNRLGSEPPTDPTGAGSPHDPAGDRWGDLPVHVQDVFRGEDSEQMPARYREWIDAYYRRLNQRGGR